MNEHHELALWAADCADRVLAIFEAECPGDARPRQAIEAARLWQSGRMPMVMARKMAFAAHAAARQPISKAAVAAARAAGHAATTAHVATHAPHAANYTRKARAASGANPDTERDGRLKNCLRLSGILPNAHLTPNTCLSYTPSAETPKSPSHGLRSQKVYDKP